MSVHPSTLRAHPGQSIHLLDLNQDIFQHIVPFLDRPALSLLSRTCHTLHKALAVQLLHGTVSIKRPLLGIFKEFLEVQDDRHRYDFLRRWELFTATHTHRSPSFQDESTFSPSQVTQDVFSILRASHNLVSLSLHKVTTDYFLPEELKMAFSSLTQLQELSLISVGPKYQDVLNGVLPNLRVLRLDFSTDRLSPLSFLASHKNTIRELTLQNIWPKRTFPPDSTPDPFPSVHYLCVSHIESPSGLVTLARCFPNLEALTLHTIFIDEEWRGQDGFYSAVMDHDERRDFAPLARWYDRIRASVQTRGGTWPRLETLRIHDSVGLFMAPLCLTVERLEVHQPSIMPEQMAHMFTELRPRVVVLPPEPSANAFLEAVRCHLVPLEHAPSVSHLTVRLSSATMSGLSFDEVLSALSQALPRSSVSHLLLELSSLGDFGQSEALRVFYRDAGRGMQVLSSSIPSLRKIFFDIEGRGLKAWELNTASSGEWQEMGEWEALRVISVEGMRDSGRGD